MIGAGAAGCVIAGRLSQTMPDARIALIEAGGERLGLTTKIPGTAFIASSFARRNWNFETEPVPALNGRRFRWFHVLPYFKKAETNTRGASEWHRDRGPITVNDASMDRAHLNERPADHPFSRKALATTKVKSGAKNTYCPVRTASR